MKNLLGVLAIVFAIALVAFTNAPAKKSEKFVNYYFQFVGTHGQESDELKWNEISSSSYSTLSCLGTNVGCKIIATSFQVDPNNPALKRPTQVTTDGDGTPTGGTDVTEIRNKP